ncbi:MAG: cytochrome c-type biogenesis protein CcmH [Myxococcales bacterium]|nr:cytochrome c-type biogenesis protein CcmH [Myxococcales bacterium]
MPIGRAISAGAILALALAATSAFAAADEEHESAAQSDFSAPVEGAAALEGRILGPCCWTQTLDIHGSPISNDLRRELRRRLLAGESADAIQADFVRRYGERILAVPPGNPLKDVGVLLSLAFGAAGIGAGAMLLRWRRRAQADQANRLDEDAGAGKKPRKRDAYDDQIDSELEKL